MKYSQIMLSLYMAAFVMFYQSPELTYIEDFFGMLLLVVFSIESFLLRGTNFSWHWTINILIIYVAYAFFTVLLNPESIRGFITFLSIIVLFYIIFSIVKRSNNTSVMLSGLLFGLIYVIVFNYDQIISITRGITNERFGGVGNPNVFAFLLILAVLLLLRPLYQNKEIKRWLKLFITIMLLGCSYFILIATGSRKGMILLALIFVWTFYYYNRKQSIRWKLVSSITFVSLIFVFISWFQNTPYYDRFDSILLLISGETSNVTGFSRRANMITTGIDLWAQKPLLGWGFQAYKDVANFGTYSHNNYIEILVNSGLVGLILYYSFFISLLFSAIKKYTTRKPYNRGMVSWVLLVVVLLLVWDAGAVSYISKPNWILTAVGLGVMTNTNN